MMAVASGGQASPDVFPAMVSRSLDTGTVNSVFQTGQTVEVGGASTEDARTAAHLLVHHIWLTTGIEGNVTNFDVRNMVCRGEVPYSAPPPSRPKEPMPPTGGINMRMLETDYTDDPRTAAESGVSFQPEKFPGLKWRMQLPNGHMVTFAWFERGRGVVTGLRSNEEVYLCNMVVRGMPSYERGNEYRDYNALEHKGMQDEEAKQAALEAAAAAAALRGGAGGILALRRNGKRVRTVKEPKCKKQPRLTSAA